MANKLSKKEIVDFTENLERTLLHAYNAIQASQPPSTASKDELSTDAMTEEQKAQHEA